MGGSWAPWTAGKASLSKEALPHVSLIVVYSSKCKHNTVYSMKRAEVCKKHCGTYSYCETKNAWQACKSPNNGHQRPAERSMGESLHGFKRFLIYTNIIDWILYLFWVKIYGISWDDFIICHPAEGFLYTMISWPHAWKTCGEKQWKKDGDMTCQLRLGLEVWMG